MNTPQCLFKMGNSHVKEGPRLLLYGESLLALYEIMKMQIQHLPLVGYHMVDRSLRSFELQINIKSL